jgi:hypothetical protein
MVPVSRKCELKRKNSPSISIMEFQLGLNLNTTKKLLD